MALLVQVTCPITYGKACIEQRGFTLASGAGHEDVQVHIGGQTHACSWLSSPVAIQRLSSGDGLHCSGSGVSVPQEVCGPVEHTADCGACAPT
jgi:hypothetical protein